MKSVYYAPVDPSHIKKEKAKARELRKTSWWKQKLASGLCHYCEQKFSPDILTMDHILPVGRGGHSTKGNVVVACKECNSKKSYLTPFEQILENSFKVINKS